MPSRRSNRARTKRAVVVSSAHRDLVRLKKKLAQKERELVWAKLKDRWLSDELEALFRGLDEAQQQERALIEMDRALSQELREIELEQEALRMAFGMVNPGSVVRRWFWHPV